MTNDPRKKPMLFFTIAQCRLTILEQSCININKTIISFLYKVRNDEIKCIAAG